ncbi:MAG: taurine ABC transporter permease, partial [Burkholderiales bacterium]
MKPLNLLRRTLIGALTATGALASLPASAQTPIKFQLDWRFEGPAALFLAAGPKGYYKAAGLDVT